MLKKSRKFARRLAQKARRSAPARTLRGMAVSVDKSKRYRTDADCRRWLVDDDVELVWQGRKRGHMLVRTAFPRLWDLAEINRDASTSVMAAGGIRYFETGSSGVLRGVLGVPDADWGKLAAAFSDVAAGQFAEALYLEAVSDGTVTTSLLEAVESSTLADADEVRVYCLYRRDQDHAPQGYEARCTIQRWRRSDQDASVFLAPGANSVGSMVSTDLLEVEERSEWGRPRQRLRGVLPSPSEVSSPIDAVYMWVDGSDPAWISRMLKAKGLDDDPHAYDMARFRDRGELRYSLRSLFLHAPWIRHTYLVTDAQVPEWLDVSSPRITVVDHRDIFSESATLPVFNSQAIGSRLHHISGLAERYIIMNDDVFFNRPASPNLFFTGSGGVAVPQGSAMRPHVPRGHGSPVDSSRQNTVEIIERDYERTPNRLFRHTPVPQLRSLMMELESRYPEVFDHLEKSQFRSHADYEVNGFLHHNVALMTQRGEVRRHPYRYIDLASEFGRNELATLRPQSRTVTFCINDLGDGEDGDSSDFLEEWMRDYFPVPSPVEKNV